MKTVIVYEKKSKFTEKLEEVLKKYGDVVKICMTEQKVLHETYGFIREQSPHLVVSVDLAGLVFRTELDGYALNQLPARVLHLVTRRSLLNDLPKDICFNLSHLLMAPGIDREHMEKQYPGIPYFYGYDEKMTEDNTLLEQETEKLLKELWLI